MNPIDIHRTCSGCKRTFQFHPLNPNAQFHYCSVCKTETHWAISDPGEAKEASSL